MRRVIYIFGECFHYTTQEYHLILLGGTKLISILCPFGMRNSGGR